MKQKGIGTPVIIVIIAIAVSSVTLSGIGVYLVTKGEVGNQGGEEVPIYPGSVQYHEPSFDNLQTELSLSTYTVNASMDSVAYWYEARMDDWENLEGYIGSTLSCLMYQKGGTYVCIWLVPPSATTTKYTICEGSLAEVQEFVEYLLYF